MLSLLGCWSFWECALNSVGQLAGASLGLAYSPRFCTKRIDSRYVLYRAYRARPLKWVPILAYNYTSTKRGLERQSGGNGRDRRKRPAKARAPTSVTVSESSDPLRNKTSPETLPKVSQNIHISTKPKTHHSQVVASPYRFLT